MGEVMSLYHHLTHRSDPLGVAEISQNAHAKELRAYAASKGANVVVIVDHNFVDTQLKLQANTLYRC